MDQPERGPIILEGHEGEATSVDWYVLHTIVVFFLWKSYQPYNVQISVRFFHNFQVCIRGREDRNVI